ncbi:UDP-N-acetylglucosamine 1-carboxyvinyltransferase [Rothia sp. P6271]|uniref:UDP-N-acetylglucosamine 1-carboxyvinyltransferase n=1 Tax=Rothia sp. P6271 TaxID=3402659 RepID=UPI003AD1E003
MISALRIEGGTPLVGEVKVRGAKNLVPKAMVAALLGSSPSLLRNVPEIKDVKVVTDLVELHGVTVEHNRETGELTLDPSNVSRAENADIHAHAGDSRIPILLCGPLLHTLGEAFIPDLGGCRIGDRPVDFHFKVLQDFGAKIDKQENGISIKAPKDGLKGNTIELSYPSVGTTEQVLLTAVLAQGKTELKNAAVEPEIMDLIAVLQKMGAVITVETDRQIIIEGTDRLEGYTHDALPDRNEAASWASAALATGGDIFVRGANQKDMSTYLNVFRKMGGGLDIRTDGIRFYHPGTELNPLVLETNVHPGFMTDWQQPLVVAMTQAQGVSVLHETVYENRFGFTDALIKMGATVQVHRDCLGPTECRFGNKNFRHSAIITGKSKLHGADINVPDLRGGFSHVIAALAAEGTSNVTGVSVISRGYEHFGDKLTALGAKFEVID